MEQSLHLFLRAVLLRLSIDYPSEEKILRRLPSLLRELAAVRELNGETETYLSGSVAEGRRLLSSDIHILVVASREPGLVLAEL